MSNVIVYDIEVLSSLAADCGSIVCMSYKTLNKGRVKHLSIADYAKTYRKNVFDDSKLIVDIAKILDRADILIGHNAKSTTKWGFDLKYINTRLIHHGHAPLKYIAEVDTLHDMSKKHLRLRSNKLIEVAKFLGAPEEWTDDKDDMKFPQDWNKVIIKEPGSMKKMLRRCDVDVLITEFVYNKLKTLVNSHPNIGFQHGLHKDQYPCPLCGKSDMVYKKDNRYLTHRQSYERLHCKRNECGGHTFKGPSLFGSQEVIVSK